MQIGRSSTKSTKNHQLLVVLILLILVIISLTISLVWINVSRNSHISQNDTLIDTSEKMAGWEGPISDSAKATVLTETIQDKLSSDPDYNPDQAVAEYQSIFNQATGDLKFYVALEYANYIYNTYTDINRATEIINSVENLVNSSNEEDFYLTLADLYTQSDNSEMANYYQQIWSEKAKAKATQKEPGL